MVVQEPKINEMLYNHIKMGHNSIDELMKLKTDFNIDIIEFVEALNNLEDNNLITRLKDRFFINDTFKAP